MTLRPWQSAVLAGIGAEIAGDARTAPQAAHESVGPRSSLYAAVTRILRETVEAHQHHATAHGDCGR